MTQLFSNTIKRFILVFIKFFVCFQKYHFDDELGLQIGGTEEKIFYMMEMHYDNPGGRTSQCVPVIVQYSCYYCF